MMLTDTVDLIYKRLSAIEEYLSYLEKHKGVSVDDLEKDVQMRGAVERYLQLAIESCISIAELIISDQNLPTAETSKDAIMTLGEHDIINKKFAKEFCRAVGFRNIIVHDYLKIDYKKVSSYMKSNLKDFRIFIKEITAYLK